MQTESKQREKQFVSEIKQNESNETWIVHKTSKILNDKEVSLKYKGPTINSALNAIYTNF